MPSSIRWDDNLLMQSAKALKNVADEIEQSLIALAEVIEDMEATPKNKTVDTHIMQLKESRGKILFHKERAQMLEEYLLKFVELTAQVEDEQTRTYESLEQQIYAWHQKAGE